MADEEMGPRQRGAETKRRRTREKIINGVLDLYDRQKVGDYTLERIGQESGVSPATIAYHYPKKYDVLKTAHERLLAPLIEPIAAGVQAETYRPDDGVKEVMRYVYAAERLCQTHRALTVAMIRAYFEVPPEEHEKLYGPFFNWGEKSKVVLGGHIALGMAPIMYAPPFTTFASPMRIPNPSYLTAETFLSHALMLLMGLYHAPNVDAPAVIAREVCSSLLPLMLPGIDLKEQLESRFPDVRHSVDEWIERIAQED